MPRRALILITVIVLALHWWVLGGMPLGGTDEGRPERIAFHTRMVTPEPETEPETAPPPAPAPAPPPAPKPPKPRPKPAPKPAPAPVVAPEIAESPAPDPLPEPEPAAPTEPVPEPDTAAPIAQPAEAAASEPVEPMPPASAASAPSTAASAPAPAASAPSPSPEDELSAGVDIRPPGAAGAVPSTNPPPIHLPASTTLKYAVEGEVKKMRYNVNGELAWKNEGGHYEVRQEISAFLIGSRSQTSTGTITANGLAPTRFGDKGRREVAAHFDFEQHVVTFSANTNRIAISAGVQDRVSVLIQLGAMLAAAPDRYPPGTQIAFTTVGPRNADRWTFTVGETETLDLPAGPTRAVRLQKLPRNDHDLHADLWLGTAQQYLPVRLRLTQPNGDYAELALR